MGGSVRRPSPLYHAGASLVLDQLTLPIVSGGTVYTGMPDGNLVAFRTR